MADHTGHALLSDRQFHLRNVTAGTDQVYETEQDALDAVTERVANNDEWVIVHLPPSGTGAGRRIHSGRGPV